MRSKGGGRSTRQWMLWAFKIRGCVDCGVRPPEIELSQLHCDHLDPSKKTKTRSRGLTPNADLQQIDSNGALLDELAGCEPVCFDCHKIRTRRRANGSDVVGAWEQRELFG